MEIISEIILNMRLPAYSTVYAVQGDTLTRKVRAQLMDGSTPWEVPGGATMVIRYRKPDGTVGYYDTDELGNAAYTVSGEYVIFTLAAQTMTVAGAVYIQLDFYAANDQHLSTFTLTLDVSAAVVADGEIASEDYINALTRTAAQLAQDMHIYYGAPRTAAASADMTDHDLVYVYTGTTTASLTNGHWYFWNGSAWTDGGVYNSTAFTTDTTLTVSGAAADAKATGDTIRAVTEKDQNNLINEAYLLNANGCTVTDGVYSTTASALYNAFSKNGSEFPVDFEWEPLTKYTFRASVKNESNQGSLDGLLLIFGYSDGTSDTIPIKRNVTNWFEVVLSSNPEKTVTKFSISYQNGGSDVWQIKEMALAKGDTATYYPYHKLTAIDYYVRQTLDGTIKNKTFAVDELGSVFESQNALYLYHQAVKESPEYEYHFDADYDAGRWTQSDISGNTKSVGGWNTSKHPVDVDDSMVLYIPAADYSTASGVSFCVGQITNGKFTPVFTQAWTTANKGRVVNIRAYRSLYAEIAEPKIILQTSNNLSMLKAMRLKRSNPFCELTASHRISMTNANVGGFIPSSARVDGRLCSYYSSKTSMKTKRFTYGTDGTGINVDAEDHSQFICARQVLVNGAATGSYSIATNTGAEGNLTLTDTFETGAIVVYSYIVANLAPYDRRPWQKWLYANGLQLDAIFYDANGEGILWYNGEEGSVNNCLNWTADKLYPTLIKIPDNAVSYYFSVYGDVSLTGSPATLGKELATNIQSVCSWGYADHALIPNEGASAIIGNAKKLLDWTYPAETIPSKYHLQAYHSTPAALIKGVLYAPTSRLILGTNISYYTYLSIVKKEHGLSAAGNWGTNYNADFGMMCAAFVSASLGVPHYQGAEYFLQKYGDKLELVTKDDELRVGDILITVHYYRPRSDTVQKKNLNTHVTIVSDALCDNDKKWFVGYTKDESTNIWTRQTVSKASGFVAYTPQDQYDYTMNPEHEPLPEGASRVCESYTWRLRLAGGDIPNITDSYRFAADKEYNPLANPNIEFPPVMSRFGDRCVIGNYPVIYGANQPGYRYPECGYTFYVEKDYQKLDIYRSVDGGETYNQVASDVDVGTTSTAASGTAYYGKNLSDYITAPGIYKIIAKNGNGASAEKYGLFLLPDYPETISRSENGKIITISGAALVDGKVRCQGFDEVWLRVIPYPAENVDGAGEQLPWANYLFIPAAEVWDEENERIDLGSQYDYAVAMTLFDNDFGGVSYRFTLDNDEPLDDDESDDGDDSGGGNGVTI